MTFLISEAWAEGGAAAGQQGVEGFNILFIVLMFVAFYFLLIRPQNKRAKEHRELVASLAKGDEVVSTGGLLGKITEVGENFLTLEIASGVMVKLQRSAVQTVLPKGTLKSV